jgi:hypothetical protein
MRDLGALVTRDPAALHTTDPADPHTEVLAARATTVQADPNIGDQEDPPTMVREVHATEHLAGRRTTDPEVRLTRAQVVRAMPAREVRATQDLVEPGKVVLLFAGDLRPNPAYTDPRRRAFSLAA